MLYVNDTTSKLSLKGKKKKKEICALVSSSEHGNSNNTYFIRTVRGDQDDAYKLLHSALAHVSHDDACYITIAENLKSLGWTLNPVWLVQGAIEDFWAGKPSKGF